MNNDSFTGIGLKPQKPGPKRQVNCPHKSCGHKNGEITVFKINESEWIYEQIFNKKSIIPVLHVYHLKIKTDLYQAGLTGKFV
jgi:hypothetical protein